MRLEARKETVAMRQCGGAYEEAEMCTAAAETVGARPWSEWTEEVTGNMEEAPHFECNQCAWEEHFAQRRERHRGIRSNWEVAATCRCVSKQTVHPATRHSSRKILARCIIASLPADQRQVHQIGRSASGLMHRCMLPSQ